MSHQYQTSQWFYAACQVGLYHSLKQKPYKRLLCATSIFLLLAASAISQLPENKLLAQTPPTEDLEAASFYQQGVMRYHYKDLQAAEFAFRQALRRDPNLAIAHNYLGNIMLQQNCLDIAVQEYTDAIRINPNLSEAYYNLGLTFHRQGKIEAAITAYRQALLLDPTMVKGQYNLGLALYEKGQKNEAISAYQQAINLDSGNANAYFNLAIALQDEGRNTEAIAAYRKILDLNPTNAVAYNSIANLLTIQGRVSEAIATYIEAIRYIPHETTTYYNLGVTLYNQGDLKNANRVLKRARNQYREQGNIKQADQAERLIQQIVQMQKHPEAHQILIQIPRQPETPTKSNPVSVDLLPPKLQQMPNQPETPLETPVNPTYVPISHK
jgi:tetratricopeptide (TPR) repeat protein